GHVIGTGTTWSDVDLVTLYREETTKIGTCGPYARTNLESGELVDHRVRTEIITVVDRRTGQQRAERSFKGTPKPCPATVQKYDTGAVGMLPDAPDPETELAWLRTLVAS